MFANDNIAKNDYASTFYKLDINIMMPCHKALTMNYLDHYIV